MSDWTWHRQTEDELTVRSSLGGGSRALCTFVSSVFSLSLRSVIRLQLRQSERKKRRRDLSVIYAFTHRQKEQHGDCSYWMRALQCVQTGGAELMVSSGPPELQAGFLHLQHSRNNCSYSAFVSCSCSN